MFVESMDPRILAACSFMLQEESIECIWLGGKRGEVLDLAGRLGLNLDAYADRLIFMNEYDSCLEEKTFDYLSLGYRNRRKMSTEKKTLALAKNELFQAACLLSGGLVDVALAGVAHPTGDVIRAALSCGAYANLDVRLSVPFVLARQAEPHEETFSSLTVR